CVEVSFTVCTVAGCRRYQRECGACGENCYLGGARPKHHLGSVPWCCSATLHSITSLARASTKDGISSPITLALLRLITHSYLVGACTGRSPGFSPRRMRLTYPAAPRH